MLSPAKWYISIEDLYLKEKSFKQFKQAFGEYRERYCIPEAVYAGNADNRLYLNCIDDFYQIQQKGETIMLKPNYREQYY